jgi:hypothetical protein
MRVFFLQTAQPLTKTFSKLPDGSVEKTPYPNIFNVTSVEEVVKNTADLALVLDRHATAGDCLVKGLLHRKLVNESRAGSTNTADTTDWICLDIDGLPDTYMDMGTTPPTPIKVTPDTILDALGMGNVSYVLQWSASHNIGAPGYLRCHLFVRLTSPIAAPVIKQWLIQINHTTPLLAESIRLTKTGNALSWPLDVTACQNDKLIYITPPILKGIKYPLGRTPRISYVAKSDETFSFPSAPNAVAANKALTDKRIADLRNAAGLPARKLITKMSGTHEILPKPDACEVTETRTERGFTYFNLNGGDSWAYFHPEDNPDYIHNFKGEPIYLTKELLPAYWATLTSKASRTTSTGLTYLAFLDRRTGTYFRGTYDQGTDTLDLNPAKNETQIRHFAEQFGVPLGSYIAEWDMTFDPKDSVRVDFDNKTINTFQLTEYMRATVKRVPKCPPTIFKIIHHVLGSDTDCTVHFINWLAFILQERTRTLTAWVLHGTEGTGKGVLMNRILRPLLGRNQTTMRRMEEFNEPYNAFMKQCFLVFVDEVEAKAFTNEKGVMAKLRNFIVEPTIQIRQMYSNATEWENFTNWLFASNRPEPVVIPADDRRFNVGKYQPKKLGMTDKELDLIPGELQNFHDFLIGYPVDRNAVATPLENEDRDAMIAVSQSSVDTVVNALLDGDMKFLLDQLPSTMAYSGNAHKASKIADYKHAVQTILVRADAKTGDCTISRDELHVIFEYVVGNMPESPNKFTSLLKHHRIRTGYVWVDGRTVHGIKTKFKDVASFGSYAGMHFPAPPKPTAPSKPKPTKKAKP